jgi:hypothetical protein
VNYFASGAPRGNSREIMMLIEIRTDSNIEGGEKLTDHLKGVVQSFGPNGTSKIRSRQCAGG